MSVVLATGGYDHKIRFWDAPSGRCSRIIKFHDSPVHRLEISPDKQFIAAAGNPVIRVYEVTNDHYAHNNTGADPHHHSSHHHHHHRHDNAPQQQQTQHQPPSNQAVLTLEGHNSSVTSIGFQKDGRYLYSGSEDGTLKVWDLRTANFARSFHVGSAINSVALRSDRDEFVTGDQAGRVQIWDLGTGKCMNELKPCAGKLPYHHHLAAQNLLTPSRSPSPITDASAQHHQRNHHDYPQPPSYPLDDTSHHTHSQQQNQSYYSEGSVPIQAVDISEDSRTLVAISNHGTVFVWDPSVGRAPTPSLAMDALLDDNGDGGTGENLTHESLLLDGSNNDMSAHVSSGDLLAASLLTPITKFRAHAPGTYCLHGKIAPDCRHLVTCGSDGTAKLWDTTTWELQSTLSAQQNNANGMNGNQNGGQRTGNDDCNPWVWDAAFCADSTYLVTASSDHIARLWNLKNGLVIRQYHGHESAVTSVALNDSNVI